MAVIWASIVAAAALLPLMHWYPSEDVGSLSVTLGAIAATTGWLLYRTVKAIQSVCDMLLKTVHGTRSIRREEIAWPD